MKQRAILLCCAVALSACSDVSAPSEPSVPDAAFAMGGNILVNDNITVPWNASVYNPCEGENVATDGELHIRYLLSEDGRGGYHEEFHVNPAGVRGTGLTTGATYRATGAEQSSYNEYPAGTWQSVHQGSLHLIDSGGAAESFVEHFIVFARKEPGQPPVFHIDHSDTTCH